MGKRRQKKSGGGDIPEWVVTFGDLMSLLLCFFILLQAFSELKKDREYQRVITAVKEAFGYVGGIGVLPVDDPPLKSMVEILETMAVKSNREQSRISRNVEAGVDGPHMRVTRIREGIMFTIGGPGMFEPLSAEIREPVRREIEKLVPMIKGRRNKINIVGHSASKYLPPGSPWADLDHLSYARAEAVRDLLLASGIDDRVFRLEAAGDREPIRPRATGEADASENRRVDIILTEMLVDDVNTDAEFTDPEWARGG
ncbi:MAG: flagellar motor protein MotB [Phycisphaerales bacterium]